MVLEISLRDVKGLVGQEVGLSRWFTVDQSMIDTFADATLDHQFIHTDPERARKETPFGGTIAHGFLTLSLLSAMNFDCVPKVREQTMGINFGFDKVRFMTPVKCGAKVRGRFMLKEARFRGAELLAISYAVTVEVEGERKPALTADWITLIQFAAADRPEMV